MVRSALTVALCLTWCGLRWPTGACAQGAAPGQASVPEPAKKAATVAAEDGRASQGGASSKAPRYGAKAEVEGQGEADLAAAPQVLARAPGALGDPYRVIETLPGAAPMVSGLPYVYVRGSPPSGNGFYYDGIPLPQLFHLGVGPSILHPRLLGEVRFDAGVTSAAYGRRVGATVTADGPPALSETTGEIELRLLDANAFVGVPVGEGSVRVAGRFGYPGLLAPALGLELSFSYWDYALRAELPLGADDRVELIAFGSRDLLDDASAIGANLGYLDEEQALELQFHRAEVRLVRERKGLQLGLALRAGTDLSVVGIEAEAQASSLSSRVWAATRFGPGHRLEAGADVTAVIGRVRLLPRDVSFDSTAVSADERLVAGAYGDLTLATATWSTLALGLRSDVYRVGDHVMPSLDPRVRWSLFPAPDWVVDVRIGLVHQPVVFAFPLPAFTDVAIDRGLQEGMQAEVGIAFTGLSALRAEANLFVHRYTDLLLPEVYLRALAEESQRVDALSYGLELFLTRARSHAVSGWVSYTLGVAQATEPGGATFSPEFDIRHLLSVVSEVRLGAGWSASGAFRLRSGKPINQFTDGGVPPAYDVRLPAFLRVDGRLSKRFKLGSGTLEAYLEVLNLTLSREAIDVECLFGGCRVVEAQPIWFPNLGLKASL